uniref:Xaa-Pro aminopeptidase 2 n=1 Tax=Denticeps clupeoides TaxID=299321 RepID=A0AAY4BZC4_9TELE
MTDGSKMSWSVWILIVCLGYLPPTVVNTTLRLRDLRETMKKLNISAYIIPNTDAHLSEYIAPRDARVAFMTGFTGSAGTAVVTPVKAALWTDSRYWVQADREMDCNWDLETDGFIRSITDWLIREVPEEEDIGFDPFLFSVDIFNSYSANLAPAKRNLKSLPENLVDKVWSDRPAIPANFLTRLPDSVIERTWPMKVEHIRNVMKENPYQPTALLLSALDETAWLFNLRGNDIPYNPFFYSYTLLTLDEIWLFVHMERLTPELKEYLNASCYLAHCVQLIDYGQERNYLKNYVTRLGVRVWVGTEYTNQALYELITPKEKLLTSEYSPVLTTKAVKDQTEQRILREAHVRDAVAVMQLLLWLEQKVPEGRETEITAALYVDECRWKQKNSRGPSFQTISASGPNAALAHYSPTNETARVLTEKEMYLVDSGGQYLDGTTDITRTVHWGTPSDVQKEAFTRVLMGNIEISRLIFPDRTRGVNVEMLGRRALWEVGLNYGHGTGHGVGNYFGVHEWPVGFQSNNIPFQEGMFTSIEPGYYKENEFGIRIEDIAVLAPVETKYGNNFLTFDTVSLVPYDRKLIDTSILSLQQLQWLDRYYKTIRDTMGPELQKQGLKEVHDWMMKHTEPFLQDRVSALGRSSFLLLILLPSSLIQHLL